jgi:hypothetical protein
MENKYFGRTRNNTKRLAFQLAVKNKIPHSFSAVKETAGKNWFKQIMKRYIKKLLMCKPTEISTATAKGF